MFITNDKDIYPLIEMIKISDYVCLNAQTTNKSLFSPPVQIKKNKKINGVSIEEMKKKGIKFDIKSRLRILTIIGENFAESVDFDYISDNAKRDLLNSFKNKIIFGHNLAHDLSFIEIDASRMVDTMLLSIVFDTYINTENKRLNELLIKKSEKKYTNISQLQLSILALYYENREIFFKDYEYFMHNALTEDEYIYCINITKTIKNLVFKMLSAKNIEEVLKKVDIFAYRTFEEATKKLVYMHKNGMKIDKDGLYNLRDQYMIELKKTILELQKRGVQAKKIETSGLTNEIKEIIKEAIKKEIQIEVNNFDNSLKKLNSEIADLFLKTQHQKKMLSMISMMIVNEKDGKLHPQTKILAKTGRTTSDMQNIPAELRKYIVANNGYSIISFDYSSIELRIAAALAVRNYRFFLQCVKNKKFDGLNFLNQYKEVKDYVFEEKTEKPILSKKGNDYTFRYANEFLNIVEKLKKNGKYLDENELQLIASYRNNIDPHLLTALKMTSDIDVENLKSLSVDELEKLKKEKSFERKKAKAVNFGLLYKISAKSLHQYGQNIYDLDWTIEEAEKAKKIWLESYPEIWLWQFMKERMFFDKKKIYNKFQKKFENGKLFFGSTLSGRKVFSEQIQAILNYEDQGTGAEIALNALAHCDAKIINFVHDEIVIECRDEDVERIRKEVSSIMKESANKILNRYGIDAEVESTSGKFWGH